MKRSLFIVLMLVLAVSQGSARIQNVCEGIFLQVRIYDPTEPDEPYQKSPVTIPTISLDGHTIIFDTPCDGSTLRLVDENDNVVYSTVIPTGTTSLVLPLSLSGEYEIQIIQGNICFYGFINL